MDRVKQRVLFREGYYEVAVISTKAVELGWTQGGDGSAWVRVPINVAGIAHAFEYRRWTNGNPVPASDWLWVNIPEQQVLVGQYLTVTIP